MKRQLDETILHFLRSISRDSVSRGLDNIFIVFAGN